MLSNSEKGTLIKLFNRDGYVLDFSTADFDAFTMDSIGVPLCETYKQSKGKSLIAYIKNASDEDAYKLLSDLFTYYETQYSRFEPETQETDIFGIQSSGAFRLLYQNCRGIIDKYREPEPNTEIAKSVEESFSTEYMSQQIKLMLDNQETYPAEAIGKAKELVESCCRTILKIRCLDINPEWKFHQLVGYVLEKLDVMPNKVDENSPIGKSLKKIYGSLKGIVLPIAEIRNEFGTGHGRTADFEGIDSRHAKLLVGMSITLVQFLWSTHEETLKAEDKNNDDGSASTFHEASEEAVRNIVRNWKPDSDNQNS